MKEKKLKQVTVTDVRYHFPKVERLLRRGEVLQVPGAPKSSRKSFQRRCLIEKKKQEPSKAKG